MNKVGSIVSVASLLAATVSLGVLGLLACRRPHQASVTHVYYREARVDGHHDITGMSLVPAESIACGGCYRFTYCDGELNSVALLADGEPALGSSFGDSVCQVHLYGPLHSGAHTLPPRLDDTSSAFDWVYVQGNYVLWEFHGLHDTSYARAANGVDAVALAYSDDGQRLTVSNLNRRCVAEDSEGVAVYLWQLDSVGNRASCVFVDGLGWRTANRDSVWGLRRRYGPDGSLYEEHFLGRDGSPCRNWESGVAGVGWLYDDCGRIAEERFLGLDGRLQADRQTGVAVIRWEYNKQGQTLAERFYDVFVKPTLNHRSGVAAIAWAYDSSGNTVEERYYGEDGLPMPSASDGAVTVQWEYGPDGTLAETRYCDARGRLVESRELGVARIRWREPAGEGTEVRYYGADGRPKAVGGLGAAVVRVQRSTGPDNCDDMSFFGDDGRPIRADGIGAAVVRTYLDDKGNVSQIQFMDEDGVVLW